MPTAKRALYLLLALPLGTAWFTWLVTMVSLGVSLVVVVVGIPILLVTLWSVRPLADLERALARSLLGVEIRAHHRRPTEPGRWPAAQARLADPQTWKDWAYLFVQFPLGILGFVIVTTLIAIPLGFVTAPLWWWALPDEATVAGIEVDAWYEYAALAAVGVVLGWVAWKVIDVLGRLQGVWARLLLGSEPDPELTAQVVDARSAQARIVEAADAERRRLERDLHDGAQQRLVSLSLKLAMAKTRVDDGSPAADLIDEAHAEARAAVTELRDLARGIHPSILTDRGLAPALEDLASRAAVPTEVAVEDDRRFAPALESTAYFVVAEALANVGKYAEATQAAVRLSTGDDRLVVEVRDDGRGGADASRGSGLRGLADRVGALDGRLEVDSPPGFGTRVRAELPLAAAATNGATPGG